MLVRTRKGRKIFVRLIACFGLSGFDTLVWARMVATRMKKEFAQLLSLDQTRLIMGLWIRPTPDKMKRLKVSDLSFVDKWRMEIVMDERLVREVFHEWILK
jgi:hypothetical protein